MQHPIQRVAIQGYEGSFHQEAAQDFFWGEDEYTRLRQVSGSGESRRLILLLCDAAVMAIENSIAGSILPNYSLLQKQ